MRRHHPLWGRCPKKGAEEKDGIKKKFLINLSTNYYEKHIKKQYENYLTFGLIDGPTKTASY
jgi:hypothetical protein